jgi:hypothetical protein
VKLISVSISPRPPAWNVGPFKYFDELKEQDWKYVGLAYDSPRTGGKYPAGSQLRAYTKDDTIVVFRTENKSIVYKDYIDSKKNWIRPRSETARAIGRLISKARAMIQFSVGDKLEYKFKKDAPNSSLWKKLYSYRNPNPSVGDFNGQETGAAVPGTTTPDADAAPDVGAIPDSSAE